MKDRHENRLSTGDEVIFKFASFSEELREGTVVGPAPEYGGSMLKISFADNGQVYIIPSGLIARRMHA